MTELPTRRTAAGPVAVIGASTEVGGFGLVGVEVLPAETAEEARERWASLDPGVRVVVLGAAAACALEAGPPARSDLLVVVMPA